MWQRIREFFCGQRNPYGQYAWLVAASMAASRAAFNSYELAPTTTSIDTGRATLSELVAAYRDCLNCLHTEYPETEEGCGRADKLMPQIEAAVIARFPEVVPPEEQRRNRLWVQGITIGHQGARDE